MSTERPQVEKESLTDSVAYIVLYVRDLAASVAFYREVVGMTVKLEGDGYVEFVTTGTKFGLYDRSRLRELIARDATPGGPSGQLVFLVPDADHEAERLRRLGADILMGPLDRAWGHRTGTPSIPMATSSSSHRRSLGRKPAALPAGVVRSNRDDRCTGGPPPRARRCRVAGRRDAIAVATTPP